MADEKPPESDEKKEKNEGETQEVKKGSLSLQAMRGAMVDEGKGGYSSGNQSR